MYEKDLKGSLVNISNHEHVRVIPTGSFVLDWLTGVGGIPRGRTTEVYGPEHNGKTTIAIAACAQAQAMGLDSIFFDYEHALDMTYAEKLGLKIDQDTFTWHQPETISEMHKILQDLWKYLEQKKDHKLGLIVIDSVAAMESKAVLEAAFDDKDKYIARHAIEVGRLISGASKRVSKYDVALLAINQLREKPSSRGGNPWEKKEYSHGGRALKFYSSVRFELSRASERKVEAAQSGEVDLDEETKAEKHTLYTQVYVNCVKCKVAIPFKKDSIWIRLGEGIDNVRSYAEKGKDRGFVEQSGRYFNFPGGVRVEGGIEGVRDFLKDPANKAVYETLREQVKGSMWAPKPAETPAPPPAAAEAEKPKDAAKPAATPEAKPETSAPAPAASKPKGEKIKLKVK